MTTPPKGHKFTPRSTPLHVAQLMLQLLRYTMETWSSDPDYPFTYTNDINTTGVLLDTAFNKESKVHRTKPLVIVRRGQQSTQPVAIGDTAASSPYRNFKNKTTMVASTVNLIAVGAHHGEVDMLGSEMFNFLSSSRTILPGLTTIHQIQNINLSSVEPFEEDTRLYQCRATLSYVMQFKWTWQTEDIPLAELGFFVNDDKMMDLSSV